MLNKPEFLQLKSLREMPELGLFYFSIIKFRTVEVLFSKTQITSEKGGENSLTLLRNAKALDMAESQVTSPVACFVLHSFL